MKKRYAFLCTFIMLSVVYVSNAQPKTETRTTPPSGTVTDTGPIPGENLTETYTREYKDANNITTNKVTWTKDITGKWTFKHESFTPGGRITQSNEGKIELRNGKLVVTQVTYTKYNKDGSASETRVKELGSDGKFHVRTTTGSGAAKNEFFGIENETEYWNNLFQPPFQDNQTAPTTEIPTEHASLPIKDENCNQRIAVSIGPSYLKRDFGSEKESLMGAHFIATYLLSSNFGAGVDLSMFKKKISDEDLTTTVILAFAQYRLWNQKKDCQRFSIFARALVGLMQEKFGDISDSESGLAFGGGLLANYRLSKKLRLTLTGDYLSAAIGEQKINCFRVSFLLTYGFLNFR